jgi:uncharacterized membrane protein YecN with MAPEG domain
VVPQAAEMHGKLVEYSPKELVFIAAARVNGHGVVYCLKKFVAWDDGGK